jgi:hypothetical protein
MAKVIAIVCGPEQIKDVSEKVCDAFMESDISIMETNSYLSDFLEGLPLDPFPYREIKDIMYDICREKFPTIWIDCIMHDLIEVTHSNPDAKIIVLGLDKKEEGDYFSASSNFPYLYVASNDDLSKLEKKIKSNLEDGGENGNSPAVQFLS